MEIRPTKNGNAYSIDLMECDFANSDYKLEQPIEHQNWWDWMGLNEIVKEYKDPNCEDWKKEMFDEFCDFFACSIATEEGEENIPDRATLADVIKDLLLQNL